MTVGPIGHDPNVAVELEPRPETVDEFLNSLTDAQILEFRCIPPEKKTPRSQAKDLGTHGVNIGLMLGSLEATSAGVHWAGKEMKKIVGFNLLENDGFSFLAVARLAHYPEAVVRGVFRNTYYRLKGYEFAKTAERLAFDELSTLGKARYLGEAMAGKTHDLAVELIREGKLITGLPEMVFHMGGGFFISNVVDFAVGDKIEKAFGENGMEWRSRVGFISFFTPQILGARITKWFLSRGVISALAPPVAAAAGVAFSYDIMSSTLRYFSHGSRTNYVTSIAYEAAELRGSFSPGQRFIESIAGEGVAAQFCAGDNPLAWMVDGHEWIQSEIIGTRRREDTCRYQRNHIRERNLDSATEWVGAIKDLVNNELSEMELYRFSLSVPVDQEWLKKVNEGSFATLGSLQFNNKEGLRSLASFLQNTLSIKEDITEALGDLVSPDILEEDVKLDKMSDDQIAALPFIKKGKEREFLDWLGGEGFILAKRRRLFLAHLIWAMIEGDKVMLDAGVRFGVLSKSGEFYRNKTYYLLLDEIVGKAVSRADRDVIKKFAVKRLESGRLLDIADVLAVRPFELFEDDPEMLAKLTKALKDNKEALLKCGDLSTGAIAIAEKIERNVRSEIVFHVTVQSVLGNELFRRPVYDESSILSDLQRANMLLEVAGETDMAGPITRLAKSAGGIECNERVMDLIQADVQSKKVSLMLKDIEDNQVRLERLRPAVSDLNDKLKWSLADVWVNSVIVASQIKGISAEEIFMSELKNNGTGIYQKIAEMAFYYKAIREVEGAVFSNAEKKAIAGLFDPTGAEAIFLNGGFTLNGEIGSMNELKRWFSREEKKIISSTMQGYDNRIDTMMGLMRERLKKYAEDGGKYAMDGINAKLNELVKERVALRVKMLESHLAMKAGEEEALISELDDKIAVLEADRSIIENMESRAERKVTVDFEWRLLINKDIVDYQNFVATLKDQIGS